MSIVEKATKIIKDELDRVSKQIETELKTEISGNLKHPGRSTGMAVRAVEIREENEYARFIGAYINWGADEDGGKHLYYFNFGNKGNGDDGRIYPTRAKALHLEHIGAKVYAASVTPYGGKNVIAKVAARHR